MHRRRGRGRRRPDAGGGRSHRPGPAGARWTSCAGRSRWCRPAHMPAAEALRTRAPVLIAEVSEARMAAAIPIPATSSWCRRWAPARWWPCRWWPAAGRWAPSPWASPSPSRRYGATDVALAQELARRAAIAVDNARLYQDAQEAVRLRDEFLTVASHELNTPIATLRLSVEPLAPDVSLPDEAIPRMLANVGRQTERLSKLVGRDAGRGPDPGGRRSSATRDHRPGRPDSRRDHPPGRFAGTGALPADPGPGRGRCRAVGPRRPGTGAGKPAVQRQQVRQRQADPGDPAVRARQRPLHRAR